MLSLISRVSSWLSRLSAHLVVLIPASMLAGLLAGFAFDLGPAKVAVLPLTMLMVFPMLVDFRLREAVSLKDARAVGLAMFLDFLVIPGLAWLVGATFFSGEPHLFVGMVLAGLFPTSGMTISWTGLAKGNVGAAVKMTVIGLVVASLLAPVYLKVLAGAVVPVDVLEVLRTVVLVVGIPLVAGSLTRRALIARMSEATFRRDVKPVLAGVSTVGVIAIVFLAVGLKAQTIVSKPALVLAVLAPLVLFYGLNFALSTIAGRLTLPRGDAIAVVYGTVMRNLSIALGVAMASFGPEAALVLALAYVVQVQAAAWYVKATDRLFPEEEPLAQAA